MNLKEAFLGTDDPQKISDMLQIIPRNEWDKEMVAHLNEVIKESNRQIPIKHGYIRKKSKYLQIKHYITL